eukprot:m.33309 g.33309  ORF g.33309 m.33309 type:complete len:422 (-) comp6441_c3_seq1:478-1743(-)
MNEVEMVEADPELGVALVGGKEPTISSREQEGRSTIAGASFNFINSIVGAGIIGMPFALKEAGFGLGIILVIGMGIITYYSINILIQCGVKIKKPCYQNLVSHVMGKSGFVLLSFGQFFFPFFGMIAYSIIVGQTLPKLFDSAFGSSFLSHREPVITIFTLFFMIPLSLNKEIESLSRWSLLALTGVFVLIVIVIIEGAIVDSPDDRGNPLVFANSNFVQAIGVMAFAYVCHHNSFLIYESLENASLTKFAKVNRISVSVAAFLSLLLGLTGNFYFGDGTKDDVLDNFSDGNTVANIARLFFAVAIMLTYPIECFVAREVIENLFFAKYLPTDLRHYSISLCICLSVLGVAIAVPNLGIILELNGVINANLVAFILPGLCGILVFEEEKWYQGKRLGSTCLFIFGILLFVFGVILIGLDQR